MSQHSTVAGIILAAGKGTRMKSDLPKGLHTVAGLPMIQHVGRALNGAGIARPIVVVGFGADQVQIALGNSFSYAIQEEQLGTGHAVSIAAPVLEGVQGAVVIVPGDAPLLESESICALLQHHVLNKAQCTVASVRMEHPAGYGRILRKSDGSFSKIVEEKDADAEIRAINEVNLSIYCFDCQTLFRLLPNLKNDNSQREYYLTDVVGLIASEGGRVDIEVFSDAEQFVGVNDRWQLAQAEKAMRNRILRGHAYRGVTLRDPDTTFVGPDVKIGPDTILEPCVTLTGNTSIGSNCRIGPYTILDDTQTGDECLIYMSRLSESKLGDDVRVGPFANIRPRSVLGNGVKVGNFVEVKNSNLEDEVKASHLTYLGDAQIGTRTNIGAGSITCNYDGFFKHRTEIGKDAFIGSNSILVAPVTIGDEAITAAGSVITKDVPDGALALGRARQEVKEEWAYHWRKQKKLQKQGKS
jgi:bifunctional UDP-N-acetylglucosamine pyrophosphorylase / glucosamine-1-phosphate N-acetyltransferase